MTSVTHAIKALFFEYHLDFNACQTNNKHQKQARFISVGI